MTTIYTRNKEGDLSPLNIPAIKGKDGINGVDGVTPNIEVGEVVTLEAGEKATVTIDGTPESPVLNFSIPKGKDGDGSRNSCDIDDNEISEENTWSSDKITAWSIEQDGVHWTEKEDNFISAENTYEYKLKEIEIFGDTVQGFKDEVTHQQIVDSIKATGLDNDCRLNDDGTFTVSHSGFYNIDWSTINKDKFIQLKPNTEYSTYCWRDNGQFPNMGYILYENNTISNLMYCKNFTTGESGKVLLYPTSAQDGKLKIRVVEGKHDLSKYPYDYNLSSIEHVGELYVDEKGGPKLDEHGNKQYKIEVSSSSFLNLYNPLNAKGKINATLVNVFKLNVVDEVFVFPPENHFQTIEVDVTHFKDKYGNSLLKLNEVHKIKFEVLENSTSNTGIKLSTSVIFNGYTKTLSRGETGVFEFSKRITNIPNESVHGSGQVFVINTNEATDGILKVKVTFSIGDDDNPKTNKQTIILPCQLSRVGKIKDRLFWDESRGKYIVEKNIKKFHINDLNIKDKPVIGVNNATMRLLFKHEIGLENVKNGNGKSICSSLVEKSFYGINTGGAEYQYSYSNDVGEDWICMTLPKEFNTNSKFIDELKRLDTYFIYALKTPQLIETDIIEPITLPTYNNKTYLYINNTNNAKGTIKAKFPLKTSNVVLSLDNINTKNHTDLDLLKDSNLDILSADFDISFRVSQIEWALEDNNLPISNLKDLKLNNSIDLSRFEQAKILIEANKYNKEKMTYQLTRYLERGYLKQEEFDILIELMN